MLNLGKSHLAGKSQTLSTRLSAASLPESRTLHNAAMWNQ